MMKWLTQAETINPDIGGEKRGFVLFIWKEGALLHIAFRTGRIVDASGGGGGKELAAALAFGQQGLYCHTVNIFL